MGNQSEVATNAAIMKKGFFKQGLAWKNTINPFLEDIRNYLSF